jgi:hypothetical protein
MSAFGLSGNWVAVGTHTADGGEHLDAVRVAVVAWLSRPCRTRVETLSEASIRCPVVFVGIA